MSFIDEARRVYIQKNQAEWIYVVVVGSIREFVKKSTDNTTNLCTYSVQRTTSHIYIHTYRVHTMSKTKL